MKTTTKNEKTCDEKIDKQTEKIFSWTSEVRLTVESDIQQHLSLCRVMHISCQKSVARKYCLHLKTINEISTVSVVKLFLSLLYDLEGSYNLNCIISAVSCFFFLSCLNQHIPSTQKSPEKRFYWSFMFL